MTTLEEIRQHIRQAAHECTSAASGLNEAHRAIVLSRTATTLHTCADTMLQAALSDGARADNDLTLELMLSLAVEADRRGDVMGALDHVLEAAGHLRTKKEVAA